MWKNKTTRLMFKINPYLEGVLVGLLLSDGLRWIMYKKRCGNSNHRIAFKQGFPRNFLFFWHVFETVSPILLGLPYFISGYRKGTYLSALGFATMSLPSITKLTSQFLDNNYNKVIPKDIYELLTPVALSIWIMGDGEQQPSGMNLCTDSFSIEEVVILINVLIIKYNLNCTIRNKTKPSGKTVARIYLPASEMQKLRSIVSPHIISSMQYKINPSYIKKKEK